MKSKGKVLGWVIALGCISAMAADTPPATVKVVPATQGQASPNVDNTDMNERDKSAAAKTPAQQTNRAQDRKRLAAVRRAVTRDDSLSVNAQNVKILVQGGKVTLRGPVNTQGEKDRIEALAKGVAGVTQVDNQLDIKME
jgi:hyperosmotically inducible protein